MSPLHPNKEEIDRSIITDKKTEKHAKEVLKYNRPKHSLFKELLHPLQSIGIAPFHRYILDGAELLKNHNYQDAYNAFLMANHKDSDRLEPLLGMAHALEGIGDKKSLLKAQKHLKKALCIQPDELSIYDDLVHLLQKLGEVREAQLFKKKQFAAKTLRTNPENPVANNNLGVMYLGQAEYDSALEYFKKASHTKRSPKLTQFNLAKAWYYKALHAKDPEEGKKSLLQSEMELNKMHGMSRDIYALLLRAKIALHMDDYPLARRILRRAADIDGTEKDVFATLQLVEEHLGNITAAREAFERYHVLNSHHAR